MGIQCNHLLVYKPGLKVVQKEIISSASEMILLPQREVAQEMKKIIKNKVLHIPILQVHPKVQGL